MVIRYGKLFETIEVELTTPRFTIRPYSILPVTINARENLSSLPISLSRLLYHPVLHAGTVFL